MELISPIEYNIDLETNTLYLSCFLADITSDYEFDPENGFDGYVKANFLTQKIQNLGQLVTIMDSGREHHIGLDYEQIDPFENILPELSDMIIEQKDGITTVSIDYFDANGHFPIIHEIAFDLETAINLHPATLDFSNPVAYTISYNENWLEATVSFSDNGYEVISLPLYNQINDDLDALFALPAPTLEVYPNPISVSVKQDLNLRYASTSSEPLNISFFNVKGQKIYGTTKHASTTCSTLLSFSTDKLFSRNSHASGVLFIRVEQSDFSTVKRVLLVK